MPGLRSSARQLFNHSLLDPPNDEEFKLKQSLGLVSILVRDYDEALSFYVGTLGFLLVEDTWMPAQNKRWVVVAPPGATESRLLLARASDEQQFGCIGRQAGGRVFLFLCTDNFERDHARLTAKGVSFVRPPKVEPYGQVAVFEDLYGNLWDLIQPNPLTVLGPCQFGAVSQALLRYLRAYEAKDLASIEAMLSPTVRLQDWNLLAQGKSQVLAQTRLNFEAAHSLQIEVIRILASGLHAAAELRITVNDTQVLDVVDSLRFSESGDIEEIRAYKG